MTDNRVGLTLGALLLFTACTQGTDVCGDIKEMSLAGIRISVTVPAGSSGASEIDPDCRIRGCIISGRGVHIGKGVVVTAAHVVNYTRVDDIIDIDVGNYSGKGYLIWKPEKYGRGDNDIALIKMTSALIEKLSSENHITTIPICKAAPNNTTRVLILGHNLTHVTELVKPENNWKLEVDGQYEQGTSGSGVIDIERMCIIGVVSAQNAFHATSPNPSFVSISPKRTLVTSVDVIAQHLMGQQ